MPNHEIAKIDARSDHMTLINVYEVEPDKQVDLVRLLADVTDRVIRHQPGFVSVSIHSSLDGGRVVNYAQWASKDHFDGFMRQPETQIELRKFAALARSVSPGLFAVDSVHLA